MPQGFDSMLTDIIEGVDKNGSYEQYWVSLLNTSFRREPSRPAPEEQLRSWAEEHGLAYQWVDREGHRKVVFRRR